MRIQHGGTPCINIINFVHKYTRLPALRQSGKQG